MRVLIIEDEQPAAHKLIRLLQEADKQTEVLDVLGSIELAINWLTNHPAPELIFMDIQLEDGISFEIFETCRIQTPVIFTTAYDAYALKAFKVNSVDYLLKPIAPEDLKAALEKFNTVHRQPVNYSRLESIINQLQPKTKERFLIKVGDHYRSIPTSSIDSFFILERSTFIQTATGKNYAIDHSLDKIEQLVDPRIFFRINRNCIVNYSAIRDIIAYSSSRLKLILNNQTEKEDMLVSRERVTEFKGWMDR